MAYFPGGDLKGVGRAPRKKKERVLAQNFGDPFDPQTATDGEVPSDNALSSDQLADDPQAYADRVSTLREILGPIAGPIQQKYGYPDDTKEQVSTIGDFADSNLGKVAVDLITSDGGKPSPETVNQLSQIYDRWMKEYANPVYQK